MRGAAAVLAAVALAGLSCGGGDKNALLILISIDTCRADHLGVAGMKLADGLSPTPVIDGLARDGAWYSETFSPAPLTLPAHTTMMTGLFPDRHGVRENDSFRVPKRDRRRYPLLAEVLRDHGFDTAAFVGAQPLERRFGLDQGFRVYDQPDRRGSKGGGILFRERDCEAVVDAAAAWLSATTTGKRFLFAHFFDPHIPYERRPGIAGLPPGTKGDYLSEIAAVDHAIGRLIGSLPDGGRNAWIVVTGDHGEGLSDHGEPTHGFFLYDSTLHVPLVIRPPIGTPKPTPRPARLVDLFPTLLAAAGVESPPCDGENLAVPPSRAFVDRAETLYPWYQFRYARLRAVRDGNFKLIEGGGVEEVYDYRADSAENADQRATKPSEADRLRGVLAAALAAEGADRADPLFELPDVFGPYIGGRTPGLSTEPTDEENGKLPHVRSRWDTVLDLEKARGFLRAEQPGKAALLLRTRANERSDNPALLFWTARAVREAASDPGVSHDARLRDLDEAGRLFRELGERFRDPRAVDSELLTLRDRRRITRSKDDAEAAIRLATGEIAARGGSALTFALRADAREATGDWEGAKSDLEEAVRRDPDDPRLRLDLESFQRRRPK